MRFLPHAHRISLLSPAPVSHIFHSCRPSMPRKQKAALVPTPIKQSHKTMVVSYRPQTLHDTIHTVLPGEVLPAIPSYSEFIAVRLFVFQLTASRRGWHRISDILNFSTVISTNSLTKRLTNIGVTTSQQMIHFNSQPHEEADSSTVYMFSADSVFQLTASRRVYLCQVCSITYFNSQPHEEADDENEFMRSFMERFQLTASRRGWHTDVPSVVHAPTFQLTASRRGWLPDRDDRARYHRISTHSLTKRLTTNILKRFYCKHISTHSLTKRLTYLQMEQLVFRYISTHSLTKRLTNALRFCTFCIRYFNSQPHEEADSGPLSLSTTPIFISTHSLTKRLT